MMNFRKERLESLMAELLSKEIVKNVERNDALITIMQIKADEDMERAVVKVSIFPDTSSEEVLKYLNRKSSYYNGFLLRKMRIKSIPKIVFRLV